MCKSEIMPGLNSIEQLSRRFLAVLHFGRPLPIDTVKVVTISWSLRPAWPFLSRPLWFPSAPVFESDRGLPVPWSLIVQGEDAESLSPCLEDSFLSLPNPGAFEQIFLIASWSPLSFDTRLTECPLPVLGSVL